MKRIKYKLADVFGCRVDKGWVGVELLVWCQPTLFSSTNNKKTMGE